MKKILCAAAVAAAACTLTLFSACAEGTVYGLTKKEYAEIYGKVTDVIFDESKSAEASRSAVHYVQVDDYSTVRSTGAFVYFLKECYNNKNFVLSEKPVELTCSYASEAWGEQQCTITMLSTCDKESGKITGELYVKETFNGTQIPDGYILVDIDYDFENNALGDFSLSMSEWDASSAAGYYDSYEYRSGKLYRLSSEDQEAVADFIGEQSRHKAAYAEKMKDKIVLDADFTDEYTKSMALVDIE